MRPLMLLRCAVSRRNFHRTSSQRLPATSSDQDVLEARRSKLLHGHRAEYTQKLELLHPLQRAAIPIYKILNQKGDFLTEQSDDLPDDQMLVKMYRNMVLLSIMDRILYDAQRQGRISFYMTNTGEEGCQIASAAAFSDADLIFGQYREAGVLLWRGMPLQSMMDQCYGNKDDLGGGKQMPVHYGTKALNFVTISSPLSTQMPQSVGAAYAMKLKGEDRISVCYFGEGAASEGDAHAAFNFAATLHCPMIFFCRNNGYAISTPAEEQYAGDGIAGRGPGYGMLTGRVDGNDPLAVYRMCREARRIALTDKRPVLIEALTYRLGHHSTSDDSSAYRPVEETKFWQELDHPITRLRMLLTKKGLWNDEAEKRLIEDSRKEILHTFREAELKRKPNPYEMFNDVYAEKLPRLVAQEAELRSHLEEYGEHYPLDKYVT